MYASKGTFSTGVLRTAARDEDVTPAFGRGRRGEALVRVVDFSVDRAVDPNGFFGDPEEALPLTVAFLAVAGLPVTGRPARCAVAFLAGAVVDAFAFAVTGAFARTAGADFVEPLPLAAADFAFAEVFDIVFTTALAFVSEGFLAREAVFALTEDFVFADGFDLAAALAFAGALTVVVDFLDAVFLAAAGVEALLWVAAALFGTALAPFSRAPPLAGDFRAPVFAATRFADSPRAVPVARVFFILDTPFHYSISYRRLM